MVYSLGLPRTSPVRLANSPFAFVAALGLLRERSVLALLTASALIAVLYQFFIISQTLFFTDRSGSGSIRQPPAARRPCARCSRSSCFHSWAAWCDASAFAAC